MRFSSSILAVVGAVSLSSSAMGFTMSPTNTVTRSLGAAGIHGRHISKRSTNLLVSTTPDEKTALSAGSVELEAEYAAAYDGAIAKLSALIPEEKKPLLDLLRHFVREYIGVSQVARARGETSPMHEPMAAAGRILNGINLAFKFGMKESPLHYTFDVSHTAMRGEGEEDGNDYDYYKFGCDFFRPCMDMENSKVLGMENIKKAVEQIEAGENVIFFSNHQSEADPQVVSVTFSEIAGFDKEAAAINYVAGHKVTTDPLAIPFSMGRNLICIHSKKHIDADPDTKAEKQKQNLKAMSAMLEKLKTGGCALWVAPSGGRDRRDVDTGDVPPAAFDRKTIDMFRLMANKSKKPTHYYPMSIVSYDMCPPPDYVVAGVGEERNVRFVPVGVHVGEELISEGGLEKRREFCTNAYNACNKDYEELLKEMGM